MERRQGHTERKVDGTSTKGRTSERSRRYHPRSRSNATEGKTNEKSAQQVMISSKQNYFEITSQQSAIKVRLDQ